MKQITAVILAIVLSYASVMNGHAQAAETIWLAASTTAYNTGQTVIATVNAISATPIQGFTFQIRYDPACLQPVNAASPIPSMNGLPLPQTTGLVDASFASTTPQIANGVVAEVRFMALADCQTSLTLESAALAIRNGAGFAAPVPGITVGEKDIALNIGKAVGATQPAQPVVGTPLPLGSEPSSNPKTLVAALSLVLILLLAGIAFGIFKLVRKGASTP